MPFRKFQKPSSLHVDLTCEPSPLVHSCYLCRLNSPAIVYKTTRNVIPTLENINAVNALQWSFARSKGGFCLRRTDRFRSILLPFSMKCCYACCFQIILSFSPTHFLSPFGFQTRNWTWYPLKYYFLCIQHTLVKIKSERALGGRQNWNWPHSLALAGLGSFYSGLNFIAKVFHNQNFMLAPPLSFVRFRRDFEFVFFPFWDVELKSLKLLSLFLVL